jgi:hypothetical protein
MRTIIFKIEIIEKLPDGSSKPIYLYEPKTVCHNRGHLKNLLLIAVAKIMEMFEQKRI